MMLRGLLLILLSYQCNKLVESSRFNQYNQFKVVRVTVSSSTDVIIDEVKYLENKGTVDILALSPVRGVMDLMVAPKHLSAVLKTLDELKAQYMIQTDDVGGMIKEQAEEKSFKLGRSFGSEESYHDDYHSYEEMVKRLEALAAAHSDKAEMFSLEGKTYQGREIKAIRITNNIGDLALSDSKPMVWLDGGIHAREWISPATMMYFVDVILGEEEKDKDIKTIEAILNKYQIVIAPVINPDGYTFSCDGDSSRMYNDDCDRMWRKTRKPAGCEENRHMWYGGCFYDFCFGADPNRNWDAKFDSKHGVSDNPCTDVYPGTEAWDQPCVNAVKTYLEKNKEKLVLYVTYHSFMQLFLVPWAHTKEAPPHHEHHMKVGESVVGAIKKVHGQDYEVIQVSTGLAHVSGSSIDWVYDKLEVVDAYGFELRPGPGSEFHFLLPKEQIRETGEENVAGLLALIDNIYEKGGNDDENDGENDSENDEGKD